MNKKTSPKAKPKTETKNKTKTKKVQFNLYLPDAEKVFLTGDFNDWDVVSLAMKKDADGNWRADISLSPGRYEYRFWANGTWYDDPNAQGRVENPFGSQNCVRFIS